MSFRSVALGTSARVSNQPLWTVVIPAPPLSIAAIVNDALATIVTVCSELSGTTR
jgi:hypothetical protein